MAPKVSVCIDSLSYGRFLPQAIESVLEQSFQDFELIIADDRSTDNSLEIAQSYAQKDGRRERRGDVVYGATPPIDTLKDNRSVRVINCIAGNPDIATELATKTQMKSKAWLRHDQPTGRKGIAPDRFEIIHVAR